MKKVALTVSATLVCLAAVVSISCSNILIDEPEAIAAAASAGPGTITVTIGDPGSSASRTIVPSASDLPAIASYEVTLTCPGQVSKSTILSSPTLTGSFDFLVPGTWAVGVLGKTSGGTIVASGSSNVAVTASVSAAVTVALEYIVASASDTGSIALTLTFPKSVGIDGVEASIDGVALTPALAIADNGDADNDKVVCAVGDIAASSPLVRISLKKSGVVLLTWVERVWVYKNIATTNASALAAESFNTAPPAPASLIPSALQPGGTVTLSWPNVGTADTYTLERSEDGGTVYIDVAAITAGTLSYMDSLPITEKTYTYRLSGINTFGTSATTIGSADVTVAPAFIVAYDEAALAVSFQGAETASAILSNLALATSGSEGTAITWAFSASAIAADGTVTRPPFSELPADNITGTLTATITNNGVSVTKEFTLTVIRRPGVSFDANGGGGSTAALAIPTGSSAPLTANAFSKTGYSFSGWAETPAGAIAYADGASYTMSSTVPVILYAKWAIVTYAISYTLTGSANHASNPSSYTVETPTVALQNPTRPGYAFTGWIEGSAIPIGSTGDRTFTAGWSAIPYSISYALNGGTHSETPVSYTIESTITPSAPTRAGYTFTGWTPASIAVGSTGNRTFTAGWTASTYMISFNGEGGTSPEAQNATYASTYGALPTPTRAGYTFEGWYTEAGGSGTSITAGTTVAITAALTLYASWTVPAPVEDTKFNNKMVFDCQRNTSIPGQFTAGNLAAPYDASNRNPYIPELTVSNVGYVEGSYISLEITTAGDGDTISVAALVLKRSDSTDIRTISTNGSLGYLGAAGFIYVSSNFSLGYFFASSEHERGTSVTYAITRVSITLKSQLGTW